MSPSTIDAPSMCATSIAGIAAASGYGLYIGTPFCVKSSGSIPRRIPTTIADAVIAMYAAIPAAQARRAERSEARAARSRYVAYPTSGMTTPIAKQFAKTARMPPSPKKSAWMMSATLTAITAAHGPTTIAARVPPTP